MGVGFRWEALGEQLVIGVRGANWGGGAEAASSRIAARPATEGAQCESLFVPGVASWGRCFCFVVRLDLREGYENLMEAHVESSCIIMGYHQENLGKTIVKPFEIQWNKPQHNRTIHTETTIANS